MMLTRKQRWRRVHHQRSFVEPSPPPAMPRANTDGCPGATRPRPACIPHPIDALSLGDSLLRLVGTPSSTSPVSPTSPSPCPSPQPVEAAPPTKSVCFHHQVRVILVPSRKELRNLQLQLWWGADDYLHFRREYVHLLRVAAEKQHQDAMQQQQQERSSSSPPAKSEPTAAGAAAAENEGPTMSPHEASTGLDITPPPCCIVESEISPKAAAVECTGRERQEAENIDDGAGRARAVAAHGVVLVTTSISPEALSAAAAVAVAAAAPEVSKEDKTIDGLVKPAPVRARARSTKWTPRAGATAAAAAAAEAEFEDYRTSSMSSASEGYFADDQDSVDDSVEGDTSESDDDDVQVREEAEQGANAKDQQLLCGVSSFPDHHERPSAVQGRV